MQRLCHLSDLDFYHEFVRPLHLAPAATVGDVAYLDPSDPPRSVFFVRNNIVVEVGGGSSKLSSLTVAQALDHAILAAPTVASRETLAPVIKEMKLDGHLFPSRLDLRSGTRTPPMNLAATATDPRHGGLVYRWEAEDPLRILLAPNLRETLAPIWGPELHGKKEVTSHVSLLVIDGYGLSSKKTIPVQVRITGK